MDNFEPKLTQRKPDDHFCWAGLLRGVKLASISEVRVQYNMKLKPLANLHVLVVQTNSLGERKLTDLLNRLETLAVSFELVSQTGRFGGKLSCHEPDTRSKLNRKTET